PELNATREAVLRDRVSHIPDVVVDLRRYPGDVQPGSVHPLDLVPTGIPNMFLLDLLHAHFGPSIGHFDFSPIIPFTGEAAARHEKMVTDLLDEYDLVAGFGWLAQSRSLIGACMVLFDTNDPDEASRAREAVDRMIVQASEWGWSEYRGHVTISEQIASLYSGNDNSLRRLYSTLKDALDPAGVLSPGNHGIWPGTHWSQPSSH
ncbi:MAG: FAD-linked oxidase C-terminal domain-containing protein, partial [Propionibacteriaceae bacterium]|nr:FAD-linked oxidase C-terminal domain-containing protein [Propionibacteriaceae bacterium]